MRQFLKKLIGGQDAADQKGPRNLTPNIIKPTEPFCAIGDIHGCHELLQKLLAQIDPDSKNKLIFMGDYIDRGPDSAGVLRKLFELSQAEPDRITCLQGNHEKMMLEFIDDPLGKGARWLVNGGLDTLQSFGISGLSERPDPDDAMAACDALEEALPAGMQAWLSTLPLTWNSGNIWCAHAAMDPAKDPGAQSPRVLLWGHPAFLDQPREDEHCIVHGHTITPQPISGNSRIAVDTGAYMTGQLTAACIATDQCNFQTVQL